MKGENKKYMGNTDFRVLIQALLDKSNIKSEMQEVQKIVKQNTLDLTPKLKTASLRNQLKKVSQGIANDFNKTFDTALTGTDLFKGYENQAKQVIKHNQLIQKSFTDLRKDAYQSLGERDPVFDQYAQYYQKEEKEALKLLATKQKLAAQNSVKGSKIDYVIEVGDNDAKIEQLTQKIRLWGDEANKAKLSISGVTEAYATLKNSNSDEEKIANAKELQKQYDIVGNKLKQLAATDISPEKRLHLSNQMESWLSKNTNAAHLCGKQVQDLIDKCRTCDTVEFNGIKSEFEGLTNQARVAGKLGNSFTQGIVNQVKKFGQWVSVSTILMGTVHQIIKMKDAVIELDTAQVELVKVSDLTVDGLAKVTTEAYKLGERVAKTGTQVLGAVTEFKRAGYEMQESMNMAESAMVMTNVAEGITNTADAAGTLISVLKGFKMSDTEIISIVDKMNSVSNKSPVGFDELADGLERVSGTMEQAGNTIDQTLGLLTGGYAQLRNMEKVSSGMIFIQQRLRGIDEDGNAIEGLSAKLKDSFGEIGVSVENADGSLRSMYEIATDYAKVLPTLTSKQKQYYGEMAAGNRQITVWNSIVGQISDVEKATAQSINSVGSAAEENAKYLDSIQGKISNFKSAFEQLSATTIDSDFLKGFVDSGTGLLKVLEAIIDQTGILKPILAGFGTYLAGKNGLD